MSHRTRVAWLAMLFGIVLSAVPGAGASLDELMHALRVSPLGLQPAPAFDLKTVGGTRVTLGDQRGRAVLLYFWATW